MADVKIVLTDDNASDIVNEALATAKSSGDFKGEKGDKGDTGAQGPQGEKGEKGDKGDTAYLTDNDITNIVNRIKSEMAAQTYVNVVDVETNTVYSVYIENGVLKYKPGEV